jgi:hypothetical protein
LPGRAYGTAEEERLNNFQRGDEALIVDSSQLYLATPNRTAKRVKASIWRIMIFQLYLATPNRTAKKGEGFYLENSAFFSPSMREAKYQFWYLSSKS